MLYSLEQQSIVAICFFVGITGDKHWVLNLNEKATLAGVHKEEILRWEKLAESSDRIQLNSNTLERISILMGVRRAIELLYPENEWDIFMRKPNNRFDDESVLSVLLTGRLEKMHGVRRLLDCQLMGL